VLQVSPLSLDTLVNAWLSAPFQLR